MRQNAEAILALAGFKRVINMIKYQQFMPDPSDSDSDSATHGNEPSDCFLRIVGAVGMPGGYLPGYPASHGCIRLPMNMAQNFYENAPHGTPVTVTH
jgi:hypothetical protein